MIVLVLGGLFDCVVFELGGEFGLFVVGYVCDVVDWYCF